ncbi:MAG: hypothetical protein AB8F34_09980 [Akkermansiaceae bacterium]
MKKLRSLTIVIFLLASLVSTAQATDTWDVQSDTWVATDTLGRTLPTNSEAGAPKKDRIVGLFYYIWHGSHGYDKHHDPSKAPGSPQGVLKPDPNKFYKSPYIIPDILKAPMGKRNWGPMSSWHHWGHSIYGDYVANDPWLIRRQVQMFNDAGVDVVIFDVTNGYHYRDTYMRILDIYADIRKKGGITPSIAFNCGTIPDNNRVCVAALYRDLYSKNIHKDLWFMWKGKPLLLANFNVLEGRYQKFFNIRYSWAWTKDRKGNSTPWFGDGKNKWPWLDRYPQSYGWSEDAKKPEQIVVATAEHPTTNIGKSYRRGKAVMPTKTPLGIYFAEQWDRALEVDPEFLLVTQWNEWIAMRFKNPPNNNSKFIGENVPASHPRFVDIFNTEHNRDIEPMQGGFGDLYYYQMIDGIRRYKGVRPAPKASPEKSFDFSQGIGSWDDVQPEFRDHTEDIDHRDHHGWGGAGHLKNTTGRNDIKIAKAARDPDHLYFYAETVAPLTPRTGENWMELFIALDGQPKHTPSWEGYHYRVHLDAFQKKRYILQRSLGGWLWEGISYVPVVEKDNKIALKIGRRELGLTKDFSLRFKWSDNRQTTKVIDWLTDGDAAPNARFQYQYSTK